MAQYNIWLGNPWEFIYSWQALCEEVTALFKPVIKEYPKFDGVRVRSTKQAVSVQDHELLIYVVPSYFHRLAERFFCITKVHPAGMTLSGMGKTVTASEVYIGEWVNDGIINKKEPAQLAKTIFHEAMHNKAQFEDKALHSLKGGGLAKAELTRHSKLTEADIALMVKHLDKPHPQWTGGWAYRDVVGEFCEDLGVAVNQ